MNEQLINRGLMVIPVWVPVWVAASEGGDHTSISLYCDVMQPGHRCPIESDWTSMSRGFVVPNAGDILNLLFFSSLYLPRKTCKSLVRTT